MTTTKPDKHDWTRADAMTEAEIHAAALSDPDAQPLTPERLARTKRTPQARIIRRALGLSQEEFATRFHIPLGALRDWEQGRKDPDTAARAYLRVIGHNSAAVTDALQSPTPRAGKNTKYIPSRKATIRAADQAQPFALLDFIECGQPA